MIFCYCVLYVVVYSVLVLRGHGLTGALLRCKVTLCNNVLAVSLKNFFLQLLKKTLLGVGTGREDSR